MNKKIILFSVVAVLLSACGINNNNQQNDEAIVSAASSVDNALEQVKMIEEDSITLLDGSILQIEINDLDEPGGNNPKKITFSHKKYGLSFDSDWNDGIHISSAVLNKYTGCTEIFLTILNTDISKDTYIFSCSGKEITTKGSFVHISNDLYFDDKGNIFFGYDTEDLDVINYYFNYETKESGEVTNKELLDEFLVLQKAGE